MTSTGRRYRFPQLFVAAVALLTLSSCGANPDQRAATSASSTAAPATEAVDSGTVDLSQRFSEQDIPAARTAIDAGRAMWTRSGPSSYTLTIGLQSVTGVEHTVVDGLVVESVIVTPITGLTVDEYPKTIDEVFATVDALIAKFENDLALVPGSDECGNHDNISFDAEMGYPTRYDELGPCDDGVGFFVEVVAAE